MRKLDNAYCLSGISLRIPPHGFCQSQGVSHMLRAICKFRMPYAVRLGRKPGIYDTWPECESQVKGFPGARYKKFKTAAEAQEFVGDISPSSGAIEHKVKKTVNFKPKKARFNPKIKEEAELHSHASTSDDYFQHEFIRREDLPRTAVVYSDGCCLSNGQVGAVGGIGIFWAPGHPKNISEFLDVEKPTNQIAELRAASRALESAMDLGLKSVELRTDSKYTIKAMTDWIKSWQENGWKTSANKDVCNRGEMIRLSDLCRKINVLWVHVPGHQGIYGNEEADKLARLGASSFRKR